jgi:hypothetical protein
LAHLIHRALFKKYAACSSSAEVIQVQEQWIAMCEAEVQSRQDQAANSIGDDELLVENCNRSGAWVHDQYSSSEEEDDDDDEDEDEDEEEDEEEEEEEEDDSEDDGNNEDDVESGDDSDE